MASVAAGILIFGTVQVVRVSMKKHNKKQAKKYNYQELDHDSLWRPLKSKNGIRLTKQEAILLAKRRRSERELFNQQAAVVDSTTIENHFVPLQRYANAEEEKLQQSKLDNEPPTYSVSLI